MTDPPIRARALITTVQGQDLYQAVLPNGKGVLAHLSKKLKEEQATFQPGDTVMLELTPFDFDTARISERAEIH